MPFHQSERVARIESAASDLEDHFDVKWSEHGHEHYHQDIGEYWKPMNVRVEGDLTDQENLQILSDVMEAHNLEVHTKRNISFCDKSEDGWARLVIA
jgi:hypothetical protein